MILSYCSFNTEHVDWEKKQKKNAFLLASDIFKKTCLVLFKRLQKQLC